MTDMATNRQSGSRHFPVTPFRPESLLPRAGASLTVPMPSQLALLAQGQPHRTEVNRDLVCLPQEVRTEENLRIFPRQRGEILEKLHLLQLSRERPNRIGRRDKTLAVRSALRVHHGYHRRVFASEPPLPLGETSVTKGREKACC